MADARTTSALLSAQPVEYVDEGGTAVAVRRAGQGPAIILIPGFPLHSLTYRRLVPHLADAFTCYCVDLPGTGESRWTVATDFSFPAHARRLMRMADVFGLEQFDIIGHDSGGSVARHLALLDPKRSHRLVIINSEIPHHRPPWIPTYQRLLALPGSSYALRMLFASDAYLRSSLGFGGCFHDLRHIDGPFHARFVEPLLHAPGRLDGAMRFLREMMFARLDEFARLHRELTMPTLFVWGADDPTFPEPRARAMLPQFPNVAGFHALPDAKLFFYEEHPAEVARLVRAFVADQRPE